MNTKAIIQKLCEVIMHVGAFDSEKYNIKSVIHELEATNSCNECEKLAKDLSLLQEQGEEKEPDLDFRRDIAEELSRDQLIDRLCDMQKHYVEMRQEWFAVVHLGEKPLKKFSLLKESESITSSDTIPVTQSGKELREELIKFAEYNFKEALRVNYDKEQIALYVDNYLKSNQ